MGYRIPSKRRLLDVIERVLDESGAVRSQTLLTSLVTERLHEQDPTFRISGERIRRVALTSPRVSIQITARRTEDLAPPTICPVCGDKMRTRKNATLDGRAVNLESKCGRCPYWTGADRRVPMRYAFHVRSWFGTRPDADADQR